jgi:hypothetical protein
MAMAGQFTTGRFELSIDGHSMAVFSELAGITTEVSPVSHRKAVPATLTLKRGKSNDMQMANWHRSGIRKNGTLAICGATGTPTARYRLTNAAATKYETVTNIGSSPGKQRVLPVRMEQLTIVVERFDPY